MKISHISVSRKGVWDQCQQKYKYQYELKMETDVEEPIYFVYGSIIHRIAEVYVENAGKRAINEVAGDVLTGKIELEPGKIAPSLPEEYRKKLPKHINNIKHLTDQLGFGGKTEHPFRYDLDPPHDRNVVGFIDRVVKRGDKYIIIDYKTTKPGWWRKTKRDIADDLQLRIYSRVVQREFGAKPENIKAALCYLDDGEIVGASFSEQSLIAAEQELTRAFYDIMNTKPEEARGKVGNWCERCEFRKICPFYSLT